MEAYIMSMLQNKIIIRAIESNQLNAAITYNVNPEPAPIIVQEPEQIIVEEPEQIIVQEPEPIIVQEPAPIIVQEPEPITQQPDNIPKIIFIIPYRDRPQHLHFFNEQMGKVLSNMPKTDYKIFFAHQQDHRNFNRGAMKNIGFLVVKEKYPNHYKNITLVFNDVDTMPYTKNFLNYDTKTGTVKHFYGYKFALGGIVSIKAGDFEKTNGFPNFWAWGYEDNMLKQRVDKAGLTIDYNQFYPILDGNILQLKDGLERIVSRTEFDKYTTNTADGFSDITDLTYNIDDKTGFINITTFETKTNSTDVQTKIHSLANGNKPFSGRARPRLGLRL